MKLLAYLVPLFQLLLSEWLIYAIIGLLIALMGTPMLHDGLWGGLVFVVACGFMFYSARALRQLKISIDSIGISAVQLSRFPQLMAVHKEMADKLLRMSRIPDQVFREASQKRLRQLLTQMDELSMGTLSYINSEAWRIVYEQLLRSPAVQQYLSVSWVQYADYWSSLPANKSWSLNNQLCSSGKLEIERIFILSNSVLSDSRATEPGRFWDLLSDQVNAGIEVYVVQQDSLPVEGNLIGDFGIYGSHVCGEEIVDPLLVNSQFLIYFDLQKVAEFEERWRQLKSYSIRYNDFLKIWN